MLRLRQLCYVVFGWALLGVVTVQAAELDTSVVLRRSALRDGYTVVNEAGTFQLGVRSETISHYKTAAPVTVTIKRVEHPNNYPATATRLSDIYRYRVTGEKRIHLDKALLLSLSYPADQVDAKKVMKYWNAKTQHWEKLRSSDNRTGDQDRAQLRRSDAIVAVFAKTEQPSSSESLIEGYASWYDWNGAASNDFPMGTVIRVTNADTQAYVDSTVVSTGPFVPGRVVDLPREDFAKIANISSGVVRVTVQLAP